MSRLQQLYDEHGQSPWLDNLRRDWLTSGRLGDLVALGVRGVTSNPTIFAKAIEGEDDYDEQFRSLVPAMTVEEAYWELASETSRTPSSCSARSTRRAVAPTGSSRWRWRPSLAHDLRETVASARSLHERISRPNLLVKVPGDRRGRHRDPRAHRRPVTAST